MTAEDLRRVSGGVIGHFTPKEITVDISEKPELGKVGDNAIGLKVPANRFVVGAYIKNVDGDLAGGSGATAKVTVGSNAVTSATAFDTIKGSGVAAIDATPDFNTTEVEVKLTVATANLTAGKLTIGVIYA